LRRGTAADMSIIDQALKKTQAALNNAVEAEVKEPAAAPQKKQRRWVWKNSYSFVVIGFLLVLGSYHYLKTALNNPKSTSHLAAPTSSLTLTGTMESGQQRVAIINNRWYHINDQVNGWTVTGINENTVTLQNPATQQIEKLTTAM